jgi:hypothetical protein
LANTIALVANPSLFPKLPFDPEFVGFAQRDARLCGIAQVLPGCRLFSQFSESSVTKFLLHALSELVRLAKKTPGP